MRNVGTRYFFVMNFFIDIGEDPTGRSMTEDCVGTYRFGGFIVA